MALREDARLEATPTGTYEWNAHNYHEHSHPQFEIAMDLMEQLAFRGDEVVLDAGCGSGRLCEQLIKRVPEGRVIGIDASENMVHAARAFLAPIYGDRISIRHADLQVFCEPEIANLIFSTSALHFVPDHRLLFQNFAKILRPGGALALRFGAQGLADKPPLSGLRTLQNDPKLAPFLAGWLPTFHGADAIATRYYLQEAGFLNIQVDTSEATFDFTDLQAQPLKMMALEQVSDSLPGETLQAYFADRLESVLAEHERFDIELITARATMPDLM